MKNENMVKNEIQQDKSTTVKLCPLMLVTDRNGGECIGAECKWWRKFSWAPEENGCAIAVGSEYEQACFEMLSDIYHAIC